MEIEAPCSVLYLLKDKREKKGKKDFYLGCMQFKLAIN